MCVRVGCVCTWKSSGKERTDTELGGERRIKGWVEVDEAVTLLCEVLGGER